ncbi:MAG: hypothetical protein V1899_07970 [Planctomycetota bacterium]
MAGEIKFPDSPKDDQHWYPEFPDNKELHAKLLNGNFEEARIGLPAGPKSWGHPDDLTVFWLKDDDPKHGLVIKFDTDVLEDEAKARQAQIREAVEKNAAAPSAKKKTTVSSAQQYSTIGATYGVSLYSEKIVCKPKQAYKINFDFKGPSGGAKVWVRGWGQTKDQEGKVHDRRIWETIVNCRVKDDDWRHFEQAFHPTRRPTGRKLKVDSGTGKPLGADDGAPDYKYVDIAFLRVMLYAYWPRGQYYFDNIKIEEISDEEYERLKKNPADLR